MGGGETHSVRLRWRASDPALVLGHLDLDLHMAPTCFSIVHHGQ